MVMESGVLHRSGRKVRRRGLEERRQENGAEGATMGKEDKERVGPRRWFKNVIFLLAAE